MTDPTIVFGLGATGFSCLGHLQGRVPLMAIDTRNSELIHYRCQESFPEVEIIRSGDWPRALQAANRLVVSPGVPLSDPLVQRAREAGLEITSDIELFLGAVAAPVIGITGTNGKSTVTTLVGELLKAAGIRANTGGNLGPPALDLIDPASEKYVIELSSFQLERLAEPGLDIACVLNITQDHLNRYQSFDEYVAVKRRIYQGAERAVYNATDARTEPDASLPGIAVGTVDEETMGKIEDSTDWYHTDDVLVLGGETVSAGDVGLKGRHNYFNLVAGAAIAHLAGVSVRDMVPTLCGFKGLAHRTVSLGTIEGIRFINDSKATNVGATNAALRGLGNGRNIVLIAGGDDKGASFEDLRQAARAHVIGAVLIGSDTHRLESALAGYTSLTHADSMAEAVELAFQGARVGKGDTVLLSPACASHGMFDDYSARGDEFARLVGKLRLTLGSNQ